MKGRLQLQAPKLVKHLDCLEELGPLLFSWDLSDKVTIDWPSGSIFSEKIWSLLPLGTFREILPCNISSGGLVSDVNMAWQVHDGVNDGVSIGVLDLGLGQLSFWINVRLVTPANHECENFQNPI